MPRQSAELVVRTHVGCDLLQSAAVFRHERLVVWEYVANGLEYIDPGTNPEVLVRIDPKERRIEVEDHGRGMGWSDLQRFFTMHAENIDRKGGKPGRGFFGTGKSAAFGIADVLRVTTVQNKLRCRVELRRDNITAMRSGDPVPVEVLEKESTSDAPNGTLVEIESIRLDHIDQQSIIRFIERHIARWPKATVYVNSHLCEYDEPQVAREFEFVPSDPEVKRYLGNAKLFVKVSKGPVEKEQQGIAIYSNGVWHETTLAGCEGRDMSQFLFGAIDVPALSDESAAIPAFDLSRSMQLNPKNPMVAALYAFVGYHVDTVRRQLVEEERHRKKTEEAKRLEREAAEIASIINHDFRDLELRLRRVRAKAPGARDHLPVHDSGADDVDVLAPGNEVPAVPDEVVGAPGRGSGTSGDGEEPPMLGPPLREDPNADTRTGQPARTSRKSARQGGFKVEFREMGGEDFRATYDRERRTILINLDHPQLHAAMGLHGTEDAMFRRLAYEVAFCEYAIALEGERANEGFHLDPQTPLVEIRNTLDRLTRAASRLYASL